MQKLTLIPLQIAVETFERNKLIDQLQKDFILGDIALNTELFHICFESRVVKVEHKTYAEFWRECNFRSYIDTN